MSWWADLLMLSFNTLWIPMLRGCRMPVHPPGLKMTIIFVWFLCIQFINSSDLWTDQQLIFHVEHCSDGSLRACLAMKRGHGSNELHLPYKEIETFPQLHASFLPRSSATGWMFRPMNFQMNKRSRLQSFLHTLSMSLASQLSSIPHHSTGNRHIILLHFPEQRRSRSWSMVIKTESRVSLVCGYMSSCPFWQPCSSVASKTLVMWWLRKRQPSPCICESQGFLFATLVNTSSILMILYPSEWYTVSPKAFYWQHVADTSNKFSLSLCRCSSMTATSSSPPLIVQLLTTSAVTLSSFPSSEGHAEP